MKKRLIAVGVASLVVFAAGTGLASADENNEIDGAFLCPITGSGSVNSPNTIEGFPFGFSLTPANGTMEAGVHANASAINSVNRENSGPAAGNVPGATGFTPI